jgi:hypothetical protein
VDSEPHRSQTRRACGPARTCETHSAQKLALRTILPRARLACRRRAAVLVRQTRFGHVRRHGHWTRLWRKQDLS